MINEEEDLSEGPASSDVEVFPCSCGVSQVAPGIVGLPTFSRAPPLFLSSASPVGLSRLLSSCPPLLSHLLLPPLVRPRPRPRRHRLHQRRRVSCCGEDGGGRDPAPHGKQRRVPHRLLRADDDHHQRGVAGRQPPRVLPASVHPPGAAHRGGDPGRRGPHQAPPPAEVRRRSHRKRLHRPWSAPPWPGFPPMSPSECLLELCSHGRAAWLWGRR